MEKVLLIWDIDGTLINSKGCGRRAMDKAFLKLYNIKDGFSRVNMAGRLDWQIVRDALEINNIKEDDIFSFLDNYGESLKEELIKNPSCEILPGINEILVETWEDQNIYHALGTGNCEIGARLKLSHLGLDRYFEIGGFGDEDLERWELIDKVIKKASEYYNTNFKKENIYVIGDTPLDIECGKKLGVKSVAVATGAYKYEELQKHLPDFIFRNFADFHDFISIIKDIKS